MLRYDSQQGRTIAKLNTIPDGRSPIGERVRPTLSRFSTVNALENLNRISDERSPKGKEASQRDEPRTREFGQFTKLTYLDLNLSNPFHPSFHDEDVSLGVMRLPPVGIGV